MGIADFREIKDTFIKITPFSIIKNYTKNTPVDIYFDGSFYLYTGFINDNMNNIESIAETACYVINNIVNKIKRFNINIQDVHIYFDGFKSSSKYKTMNIRRLKQPKHVKIHEVRNRVIEILNDNNFIIHNLIIGEAEHEMFIHRNTMRPSIMMTDDSDIFHIAYNYSSKTFNDFVFIGTKYLNFTCQIVFKSCCLD